MKRRICRYCKKPGNLKVCRYCEVDRKVWEVQENTAFAKKWLNGNLRPLIPTKPIRNDQ